MKNLILIAGTIALSASSAFGCDIYRAHSPMVVGQVTDGKVVSTMFGAMGELKGSDVYSYSKGLVGHIIGHKVAHTDGSFAAFVAGGQILNPQSQEVATAHSCTPAEAGAAYLLLF